MKLIERLKNIWLKFEDLFMKNHECICCGREIPDKSDFQICEDCFSKIEFLDGVTCKKCGEKLNIANANVCDLCKEKDYNFDQNFSACYYTEIPARIVKLFKFNHRKYYAKYIAKIMQEKLKFPDDIDYITFVPLSKARQRERGYNQAEELAKLLGEAYQIEVISLLCKPKDGKHQAKLDQKERLLNLKDSFSAEEENKSKIKGKNILIIDDVFTTGTTLNECSKVLKKNKASKIYTATFAKTKFNSLIN